MAWLGGNKKGKDVCYPREHARFAREGLTCPLGAVVDLSAGGARVRLEAKPELKAGDAFEMMLGAKGNVLHVRAMVVWTRRAGWRSWEIGLQFRGVFDELAKQLTQLAMTGSTQAVQEDYTVRGDPTPLDNIQASIEIENLYEILEVAPKATTEQIAAAYRALARKYHPDHNKSTDAAVAFTRITKAYRVLREGETRQRYDVMLARAVACVRPQAA